MTKFWLAAIGMVAAYFLFRSPERMPGELLPEFSQGAVRSQMMVGGRCVKERCLTIVVAPWCTVCHRLDPTIIALRAELEAQGVPVALVIGMDKLEVLKSYAEHYARPVLLDVNRSFTKSANIRAVPYFAVTNRKGEIVKDLGGGTDDVALMRSELGI